MRAGIFRILEMKNLVISSWIISMRNKNSCDIWKVSCKSCDKYLRGLFNDNINFRNLALVCLSSKKKFGKM